MSRVTPFLWYDDQAEEAATLYTSLFPNSSVDDVARYGDAGPGPAGSVMTVSFTLDGLPFVALNGGPMYRFTEATSFQIGCESQDEVDHYWYGLTADGGEEGPCGWLKDRYGLSWQVVPNVLFSLIGDADSERAARATKAMLGMHKLDIAELAAAANG
jgi:predicted 3-demethylubiquinone-9 3-methyltransferase (glyoxalase superfamily)